MVCSGTWEEYPQRPTSGVVYCYKGSQEGADERHLQRCPETLDERLFMGIGAIGVIIVVALILKVSTWRSRMEAKLQIASQLSGGYYCRYCGKQISSDSVFCPRCGGKLI
jgi:hypothetical protein